MSVSAPYATAVLNGRRVFSPASDPQTQIWFMLYAQARQADGASSRNILLGHAVGVPLGAVLAGAPSGSALSGGALSGGALSGGALSGGALSGGALSGGALSGGALSGGALSGGGSRAYREFPQKEVIAWLNQLGLAQTSSLSVLAVELLPFGEVQSRKTDGPAAAAAPAGAASAPGGAASVSADPLGADLGSRRILRTSPLTALPAIC